MPPETLSDLSSILAALPQEGGYFSAPKIAIFFLAVLLWAHNSVWVEKDVKVARIPRGVWMPLVFGVGGLMIVLWILLPVYWLGFGLFAIIYGSTILTYVFYRNKRVAPSQTVLTMAHLSRLGKGGGGKKSAEVVSRDRTRIKDAKGQAPAWPTDPTEHSAYQSLQDLMFDAIWRRASDVRMDMLANQPVKIIYKVDGVDREREPLAQDMGPLLFAQFKRIAGLDINENRRPQQGRFKAAIGAGGKGDKNVDVDVRTSGSTAGQRMLLKMFGEEAKYRLPEIGFTKQQLPFMEKIVAEPKGVFIASGLHGSGVTTTLYAILRTHDVFMQNIHALEVTKAMDLENITQHVYDSQDGSVSFGKRFRSILRTEPDICMAGDTPDAETAALAAAAGRQGKKIYLGMAARDTFSALNRYLQGVNDNALAASSLLGVSSQVLARVLCSQCRRAYKPDPRLLQKANLPMNDPRPFFRPPNPDEVEVDKRGEPILCPVCQGTGYVGRTGVFELLVLDDDLRSMIAKGTPLPNVKVEARKKGMLYLQEVSLHKVFEGQTSINEVLRVTKPPAATEKAAAS